MIDCLSWGRHAGTASFGLSLCPTEGADRYGVFFFVWRLGWQLGAPCAMKKHGTTVLKWSYMTNLRVENTLVHSQSAYEQFCRR